MYANYFVPLNEFNPYCMTQHNPMLNFFALSRFQQQNYLHYLEYQRNLLGFLQLQSQRNLYQSLSEQIKFLPKDFEKKIYKDLQFQDDEAVFSNKKRKRKRLTDDDSTTDNPTHSVDKDIFEDEKKSVLENRPKNPSPTAAKKKQPAQRHKKTQKDKANELLQDSFLMHIGKEEKKKKQEEDSEVQIVFHGEDYKETKSMEEFMKYNFNFIKEEQYKDDRVITSAEVQHVDKKKMTLDFLKAHREKEYYNFNKVWDPKMLEGEGGEALKEGLKQLEKSWPRNCIKYNDEIGLDIIKKNNYHLEKVKKFILNGSLLSYIKEKERKR